MENQLKQTLDQYQPERLFVSVGCRYWPLLEEALTREVTPERLLVASGGIGGRASQLVQWLRSDDRTSEKSASEPVVGQASLLGTTVRLSPEEALQQGRDALLATPIAARRFETWYVQLGDERVAPKWLVSVLFEKPVARFRTADARRVLSQLGVECIYASSN